MKRSLIILAAALAVALLRGPAGAETAEAGKVYLFAYFKDREVSVRGRIKVLRGGKGMRLAWSRDGLEWKKVDGGRLFFRPTVSEMVRDPFVAQGPDGVFHLVWTTGWRERGIGYAASADLVHWRDERILPVMAGEPTTINCWAPEIFYDAVEKQFLLFWSSTIPGRFPETGPTGDHAYNHRIYYTATTDFKEFTPTRLLYDPGFECIDADVVNAGGRYVMFLKAEALHPPAKHIVTAESEHAEGPYGEASPPITPPGVWAEGSAAINIAGTWYVYYDMYALHRYGLAASDDLITWRDLSAELKMPRGVRHGNVFEVGEDVFSGLTGYSK
ncbi:MAG TPA: glycoside hydrolase family 43 protein [bacterium]|nr:glycoside hydrolase family 43 protein [bacterium]